MGVFILTPHCTGIPVVLVEIPDSFGKDLCYRLLYFWMGQKLHDGVTKVPLLDSQRRGVSS